MDSDNPDWAAMARTALVSDGRDAGMPLTLIRIKPGQTVSYRAGDAFVKLFISAQASTRCQQAHGAQMRASGQM